ncbi:hypothetical protein OG365_30800 [Streptomyces sp. NBC_00853]|uniref:hypothetical protein n=1 Tax=Streptomyces sp. NBC_00853 TaxID=2903681 RepID=UPI003873BB98|nr:hypothetical protein OG365_30800 [Streptomyces sp. NBC_00853]
MKIIDLAEQTRLLGLLPGELGDLRTEIDGVRAGEIARPVREIAPIAVRTHQLAIRCLQQLDALSTSQYAVMKNGHENLAHMSEAALRISVAASLCTYGITGRTDALLYEDGDRTADTSRSYLSEATEELDRAAGTYRGLAQNLSRRLASATARAEDQLLIDRATSATPRPALSAAPSAPTRADALSTRSR